MAPKTTKPEKFKVDPTTKIYRVFPLARAISLFLARKIALVRPSLWHDPFENFILKARVFTDKGEPVDISSLARSWYGQCWTLLPESDAMWRIYSPNKDGVCISTTVGELFDSIYMKSNTFRDIECFIGRVQYLDEAKIVKSSKRTSITAMGLGGQNSSFAKALWTKRTEFKHEEEVRILYHDSQDQYKDQDFVEFPFDPTVLVKDIKLDPRLDNDIAMVTETMFARVGCTCPVAKSRLYTAPQLVINL